MFWWLMNKIVPWDKENNRFTALWTVWVTILQPKQLSMDMQIGWKDFKVTWIAEPWSGTTDEAWFVHADAEDWTVMHAFKVWETKLKAVKWSEITDDTKIFFN